MYWLDLVLLLVLGLGALLGARSGLLWQVARVVAFAAAIYACLRYHTVAAGWLLQNISGLTPSLLWLLAYGITFLAVYLICFLVFYALEKALRAAHLKLMDRVLGAVVGVVKAGLLAGAILLGLALYATPESDSTLAPSKVASVLLRGMRVVIVAVPQDYKDRLSEAVDRLRNEAAERAREEAPTPTPTRNPDPLRDPLD
jgi:membrane protein required for colicin V production